MKKVWLALALLAAALVVALAAAGWYIRTARPQYEGTVRVPGLAERAEVRRDSFGVPHIRAGSAEDLLFAQGYVHAQERMWQMELFRRVMDGRLAELLGEGAVESDRFLRTLGLGRAAAANEAVLDDDERRLLEAYAAGVNAWLRGRDGALPPEFLVLGFEPEPWTVRHTLGIGKVMAWDLAAYGTGLSLARAVRRLGREKASHLFPEYPAWGPTIVHGAGAPAPAAVTVAKNLDPADGPTAAPAAFPAAAGHRLPPLPPDPPRLAAALLDAMSISRASNAWVIGGSRTRSGKPILANDPHLALRAPGIWYLAALHAEGRRDAGAPLSESAYDVVGVTIPGVPFVVLGHNRAIAWGFTNAGVDDIDLFIERVSPDDTGRYIVPGGSEPFRVRPETIRVRGRDEPVEYRVRSTRHGPIITPVEARAGDELLAMRWVAHDASNPTRAVALLNRAADWDGFVRAVAAWEDPHQNIVYADTAGHIGYWMGGTVPIRGAGRRPPLLPVPGWTGEWDWTGELPFDEHPHVFDPAEDFIVTANNRQTRDATAERITAEWAPPFRAMRIREMILAAGRVDAADVAAQQLDVRDALAARYRDRAADAAAAAGLPDVADLLLAWDAEVRKESRAAAVFYVWHRRLRGRLAGHLYEDPDRGWIGLDAVNRVLERRAVPWVDGDGRAVYHTLAAAAMADAAAFVRERRWGELHGLAALHGFSEVGGAGDVLDRIFGFNVGPVPADGSRYTVNVADYTGRFPVVSSSGPSHRQVVDMGAVDSAGGFILPTGQSGLPFHEHYRDQWQPFLDGRLWLIPLAEEPANGRTVHELILIPQDEQSP